MIKKFLVIPNLLINKVFGHRNFIVVSVMNKWINKPMLLVYLCMDRVNEMIF